LLSNSDIARCSWYVSNVRQKQTIIRRKRT
jgi:hypothetical protein